MLTTLTASEHDAALATGTAVLVFLMDSLPGCRQFQPELDAFADRHPELPVYVVEPMDERELADRHHLQGLPSIVFYRDGLPLRRVAGAVPAAELDELLEEVLRADMRQELAEWVLEVAQKDGVPISPPLMHAT
jgi:thioredoxin 1